MKSKEVLIRFPLLGNRDEEFTNEETEHTYNGILQHLDPAKLEVEVEASHSWDNPRRKRAYEVT